MRKLRKFLIKNQWMKTAQLPGARIDVSSDVISDAVRGYIARGKYEAEEHQIISRTLTKEDVVMEIGAGIGYISCVCASILQDKDRLHVYEANPRIIDIIRHNMSLNNVDFHLNNQLLGFENGKADFYIPKDFWSASMNYLEGAEKVVIDVVDANEKLLEIKPTYLIMDIEGAEVHVLPKMDLSSVNTICLEVHPHKTSMPLIHQMFQYLLDNGFMFEMNKFDLVYLFKRVEP